ncbi:zinc finger and SCAN domain-containing protein 31-like [Anolis carolinensis]|uniref:zinc finger and SCAN domain-containing protein 31-like n=1 Tax=Anolis carolinensis TaxID=28377 RepID=UPI002F2B8969
MKKEAGEPAACGARPLGEAEGEGPGWGQAVRGELEGPPGRWADQVHNFRNFCFRSSRGPQETCTRIRALCHQWLRPEKHSKARMMDLVVLEQFLKVLPPEMEAWVRDRRPQSSAHAVALAEAFLEPQVSKALLDVAPEVKKEPMDKKKTSQGDRQEAASPGEDMEVGDHKPAVKVPSRLLSLQSGIDTQDVPPNQDPVAVEEKPDSSGEEEPPLPDLGGSTLLMEVVEERFESVVPPARGDSKEKVKKETTVGGQKRDHDAAYISPKGTYLPQTQPPRGNPTGKERSQAQPSEFEKSFLQQLFRGKGEKAAPKAESEHRCLDCGKTFNLGSKLKLHRKIHSEEKPFECPECGKHFRHKGNLQTHQRTHAPEEAFRCGECGRRFGHSWDLKKHLKFHESRRAPAKEKAAPAWIGPRKDPPLNGDATQRAVPPDAEAEALTPVSTDP